tara:strand:+ start:15081 stop:16298 length:1218 start_codon:yes stop_codon:yes gene_type:complete
MSTKALNITYLHQYFNTPETSGRIRSYLLAKSLIQKGHIVNLVTSTNDKSKKNKITNEDGIKVHWLYVPYSSDFSFLRRLWAFIYFSLLSSIRAISIKADLIFATSTPLTIAIPGVLASWTRRAPLVFEVRDLWPQVPIQLGVIKNPFLIFLANLLERLAYKNSKKIITYAPGMKEDIVLSGIDIEKVEVITPSCNPQFNKIDKQDIDYLKEQYPWLQNKKVALCCGSIGLINGVDFVVDLAKESKQINEELIFVIIGEGKFKKSVINKAKIEGILDKNLYILEKASLKEIIVWTNISVITLATLDGPEVLWKDAVQQKFFDSVSAGKPIASNFRGFQSEFALSNDIGIILNKDDIRFSAELIKKKINDLSWLKAVEIRSKEIANNEFNREKLTDKMDCIFQSIL